MEFRWFCRQLEESFIVSESDPDLRLFEDGDFIPDQKISAEKLQENEDSMSAEEFQKGGCFGRGPSEF